MVLGGVLNDSVQGGPPPPCWRAEPCTIRFRGSRALHGARRSARLHLHAHSTSAGWKVKLALGVILALGLLALVTNGGITLALRGHRGDLNVRAVFIHILGDALSNLGIIAGAWLIRLTGQTLIDPLIAFLIAGLILLSTIEILADATNILLESLPKRMKLEAVANAMLEVPGVREVHDVHIWSLGADSRALSCHILILDMPTSETEPIAHR